MRPSRRCAGAKYEDQVLDGRTASRIGWPGCQSLAILLAIVMQQAANGPLDSGPAVQSGTLDNSGRRLTVCRLVMLAAVRTFGVFGSADDGTPQVSRTKVRGPKQVFPKLSGSGSDRFPALAVPIPPGDRAGCGGGQPFGPGNGQAGGAWRPVRLDGGLSLEFESGSTNGAPLRDGLLWRFGKHC